MANLNIMDIVSLAKAGFKYNEIKDLMTTEVPDPTPQQEPTPEPEPTPEETTTTAKETVQTGESEEAKKRIEELEKQIADLQKKNQSKDNSGNVPNPQDTLDDIVRGFM